MQQGAYQKQFNFTCEGIGAAANSSKPQVHNNVGIQVQQKIAL